MADAPPRIFSNRLNSQSFRRAVWRNGSIVGESIGTVPIADDEDEQIGGDDSTDGPSTTHRQPLNLSEIELIATQTASTKGDDAWLSDDEEDDECELFGEEEDEEDGGEEDDAEEEREEDDEMETAEDIPRRNQSRLSSQLPTNTTQTVCSLGLMRSLFGSTVSSVVKEHEHHTSDTYEADGLSDLHSQLGGDTTHDQVSESRFETASEHNMNQSSCSSQLREPEAQACMHVDGATCVGCEFGDLVDPVVRFVLNNATRVPKPRLWHLARDAYRSQVVLPIQNDGGSVLPDWSVVDIERHFEFHVVNSQLFRIDALRDLKGMRTLYRQRMVLATDGGQEIDSRAMKEYMQLVAMESKEHNLLSASPVPTSQGTGLSTSSASANSKKRTR